MGIMEEATRGNRTFAIVLRGYPEVFKALVDQARASGLYIVYTKTSFLKLVVEEVPW